MRGDACSASLRQACARAPTRTHACRRRGLLSAATRRQRVQRDTLARRLRRAAERWRHQSGQEWRRTADWCGHPQGHRGQPQLTPAAPTARRRASGTRLPGPGTADPLRCRFTWNTTGSRKRRERVSRGTERHAGTSGSPAVQTPPGGSACDDFTGALLETAPYRSARDSVDCARLRTAVVSGGREVSSIAHGGRPATAGSHHRAGRHRGNQVRPSTPAIRSTQGAPDLQVRQRAGGSRHPPVMVGQRPRLRPGGSPRDAPARHPRSR